MSDLRKADRRLLDQQLARLGARGWHAPEALAAAQARTAPGGPPGGALLAQALLARDALRTAWMHEALLAGDGERLRDALATATRLDWLEHQEAVETRGEARYTQAWLLLDAAGAGDRALYERVLAASAGPLAQGSPVCVHLHDALWLMGQGDRGRAGASLAALLELRTTAYYEALARGLGAALGADTAGAGAAAGALSEGFRRVRDHHVPKCRALVSLHAHAVVRFASWWAEDGAGAAVPCPSHDTFRPELEAAVASRPAPAIGLGASRDAAAPDLLRWLRVLP